MDNEGKRRTMEEAALEGKANVMLENNLSSVKIITKVEMKTGIRHTEWEIKAKHDNPVTASLVAKMIDDDLRSKYGANKMQPQPVHRRTMRNKRYMHACIAFNTM